jgi:hypothetical protein
VAFESPCSVSSPLIDVHPKLVLESNADVA